MSKAIIHILLAPVFFIFIVTGMYYAIQHYLIDNGYTQVQAFDFIIGACKMYSEILLCALPLFIVCGLLVNTINNGSRK